MVNVEYNTVTISACEGGWLVKQKGKPDAVYVRWESVVSRLKHELTT